eukprot:NODE_186_length_13589_cov_0.385545.p11 type:complete len:200 gc:universal NODE_186_length_13589_cov_0.385545:1527-928(-)
MPPTLKLTYANMRGRAEAIRLTLYISNIPFTDYRMTKEEWPHLKSNTPFYQVPTLEINSSIIIGQSLAILRYCGQLSHLIPSHDASHDIANAFIDGIIDQIEDITSHYKQLKSFNKVQIHQLNQYTRQLKDIYSDLTIADISIYCFMYWIIHGQLEMIDFKEFDVLYSVYEMVHGHPRVMEWNATHVDQFAITHAHQTT